MEASQYLVLDYPIVVESLRLGSPITNVEHPAEDIHFPEHIASRPYSHRQEENDVEKVLTKRKNAMSLLNKMSLRSRYPELDDKGNTMRWCMVNFLGITKCHVLYFQTAKTSQACNDLRKA